MTATPLLTVDDLWVRFPGRNGPVEAVRGIGFEVGREKVGIVGESGSGKTLTGRAILRLVPRPGQVTARRLEFDGIDLLGISERGISQIHKTALEQMAITLQCSGAVERAHFRLASPRSAAC